ncbi:DUF4105 domain-containing protein [uncultured Brevundimonas sp.]|uniref:lipoprotein N-acyltransferase Lnb domain-containing protein n=1 Tax=uncultured Brevundimonas sp. TaxID=213418 RepID=UPI0025EC13E2|nr:DUF4105 domain-containing protein [uncultured Brevundimonas sp.]
MRRIALYGVNVLVVILAIFCALAIRYWVPWPGWVRAVGALGFPLMILGLWFAPIERMRLRRGVAILVLVGVLTAYWSKSPAPQDWRDLHAQDAWVEIDGDRATIHNYRDALHGRGVPSTPRWTTATFDLSTVEGMDLILQPFGDLKAMEHVMLSFRFADGRHVVVSMEARQAKGAEFDPLAGFFRRDPLYPELATERDLFWERLARTPPDEIQIFPVLQNPQVIRIYLERILRFTTEVRRKPVFYSTLTESCMTSFIKLAPERFASVPWYDLRRWIPGYALPLFQQLGLVDASLPADELARRNTLPADVRPPSEFESDADWSAYVREVVAHSREAP